MESVRISGKLNAVQNIQQASGDPCPVEAQLVLCITCKREKKSDAYEQFGDLNKHRTGNLVQ